MNEKEEEQGQLLKSKYTHEAKVRSKKKEDKKDTLMDLSLFFF